MVEIRTVEFDLLHDHVLPQDKFQKGKFGRDGRKFDDQRRVKAIVRNEHGVLNDDDIGENIGHVPDIKPVADKRIGGIDEFRFI